MNRREFFATLPAAASAAAPRAGTGATKLLVPGVRLARADTPTGVPHVPPLTADQCRRLAETPGPVPVTDGFGGPPAGTATNFRFGGRWLTADLTLGPAAAAKVRAGALYARPGVVPGPRPEIIDVGLLPAARAVWDAEQRADGPDPGG